MVTTSSPLTLSLCIAIGAYALAATSADFLAPGTWRRIIKDLRETPGLAFLTGVVVFAIGVALVSVHNIWDNTLSAVISAISWAAVFEGLLLIAAPAPLLELAEKMASRGYERVAVVVSLCLGLALLVVGFTGSVQ